MKPNTKVSVSRAVRAAHPFIVVNEMDGEFFGRFASLYCAAQTAIYVASPHFKYPIVVKDERSGETFSRTELCMVTAKSIIPLVFHNGEAQPQISGTAYDAQAGLGMTA